MQFTRTILLLLLSLGSISGDNLCRLQDSDEMLRASAAEVLDVPLEKVGGERKRV